MKKIATDKFKIVEIGRHMNHGDLARLKTKARRLKQAGKGLASKSYDKFIIAAAKQSDRMKGIK